MCLTEADLTIPTAVDFHFAVGGAAKEKHLRGLRDRWVEGVRDLKTVEICTPDDPARYCAITSFRLAGMRTDEDAKRVQHRLFDKHRVHSSQGACRSGRVDPERRARRIEG